MEIKSIAHKAFEKSHAMSWGFLNHDIAEAVRIASEFRGRIIYTSASLIEFRFEDLSILGITDEDADFY